MDKTTSLAQLKDIHLPPPIGLWPLAPGWYVIMVLVILLFGVSLYLIYRKHQHAKAKKHALFLLVQYQKQYEQEHNVPETSARISELLRRVALVYYPRNEVASLHGKDWLLFLNKTSKGVDFILVKDLLLEAPFKTNETLDLNPLFKAARRWIQQRRAPCSN